MRTSPRGILLDFYGTVVHEDDEVLRSVCAEVHAGLLADQVIAYWRRPTLFPDARTLPELAEAPVCLVSDIDRAEIGRPSSSNGASRAYRPTPRQNQDLLSAKPRVEDRQKQGGDSAKPGFLSDKTGLLWPA